MPGCRRVTDETELPLPQHTNLIESSLPLTAFLTPFLLMQSGQGRRSILLRCAPRPPPA